MIVIKDAKEAEKIAEKTMARLREDSILPVPNNFEVIFCYYANSDFKLKRDVDALVAEKGKITAEDCEDLYNKYISERRFRKLYEHAGNQINSTLEHVSGLVDNMKSVASEYGGSLESVNRRLMEAKTKKELSGLLGSIFQDTVRVMEQNKALEKQLDQSLVAMKELKKDIEVIRHEAMTDGLTGIMNRKAFDDYMDNIVNEFHSEGKIFSFLMIDIDHFKSFNDNYGHQVGDEVLRLVSRTLKDGIKGSDTVARYGGEEFSIVLPETPLKNSIMVAENLRRSIASKEIINKSTGENMGQITISIGVAQIENGEDKEDLIDRADTALYSAKNNGRNQVAAAPNTSE